MAGVADKPGGPGEGFARRVGQHRRHKTIVCATSTKNDGLALKRLALKRLALKRLALKRLALKRLALKRLALKRLALKHLRHLCVNSAD